jgi:hypothetical protein
MTEVHVGTSGGMKVVEHEVETVRSAPVKAEGSEGGNEGGDRAGEGWGTSLMQRTYPSLDSTIA